DKMSTRLPSGTSLDLKMSLLAVKYKDFPLYRAPQSLVSSLSMNMPVIFLASLFGPIIAGYYAIGRTVLGVPAVLVSKSVSDLFYPKVTAQYNKGQSIYIPLKKATLILSLIGLIPLILICALGPNIFSIIFGKE